MLATLCFHDMAHGLCWKHFLSLLLSRNYRLLRKFPKNGYLDDMCYVKLSRNHNRPFTNIIAELSRTQQYSCHVCVYINRLQGPLHRCSDVSPHRPQATYFGNQGPRYPALLSEGDPHHLRLRSLGGPQQLLLY